jgi:WD40 repeat protein
VIELDSESIAVAVVRRLRIIAWEFARLAVVSVIVAALWRNGPAAPRCTIAGNHVPIQLSPDGERLLTISKRNLGPLQVWNARTGKKVDEFLTSEAELKSWIWERDRAVFAVESKLQAVDWRTGEIVTSPMPSILAEKGVCRTGIRDIVAIASVDNPGPLTILEACTGKQLDRIPGPFVPGLASADIGVSVGPYLVAVRSPTPGESEIVFWDCTTRMLAGVVSKHGDPVGLSANHQWMVLRRIDERTGKSQMSVWPADPGATMPKVVLQGDVEDQGDPQFSPDGTRLVTSSNPFSQEAPEAYKVGRSVLWELESGKPVATFATGSFLFVDFAPDGRSFVLSSGTAEKEHVISVVDASSGAVRFSKKLASDSPSILPKFGCNGKLLSLFAGQPSALHFLDAATGETVSVFGGPDVATCSSGAFLTPDRRWLAASMVNERIGPAEESFFVRALEFLGLREAKPVGDPTPTTWWAIAVANADTGQIVFHQDADQGGEALLADDGSTVVFAEKNRIGVWDIPARFDVASMVVVIVSCYVAAFALERLVRQLRKRSPS